MSTNNDTILAGWDPGYGANKFACVQNGEIVTYALPSSVGEDNHGKKDGLTLSGLVRGSKRRRPFSVAFDGMEFLVGPNVAYHTKPTDRMDFDRFTDSPELRATFYAGIYRIINGGACQVALAVALPVKIVQAKDEAARVSRGIRQWLVGEHLFYVDGVETALTVTNVRAKVPQPVATWFDWGMDTTGQWVKGLDAQKSPALIIDQGFNTLDVLVVEGGRINERISKGNTLGMRRAAEHLIKTIEHNYNGMELDIRVAADLIQAVVNGQPAKTYFRGQSIEVSNEAKRALKSLETDVFNFIDRMIGQDKAQGYNILLTGGGALAMSSMLLRQFPEATMMYEPVLANARGLAKMASRPGFLT